LSTVFLGYDPAILLLGIFGLWGALVNRIARPMVLFACAWGVFFLTNVNDHVRYLLPLAAGLTWASGFAAERLNKSKVGRVVLISMAGLALIQALRLDFVLRQTDTRHGFERALLELPPGSDVAVDIGGPVLPLDGVSLRRIEGLRDLYTRERNRLERLDAGLVEGPSVRALPLQNLVELDPRHHSSQLTASLQERYGADLNAALKALGITHLLLVDTTPADPRTPHLLDSLAPDAVSGIHPLQSQVDGRLPKLDPIQIPSEALMQVQPGAHGTLPASARLPLVMEFPLRDLWSVNRPGPVLTLYDLRSVQ
jgi:hypothetical protein